MKDAPESQSADCPVESPVGQPASDRAKGRLINLFGFGSLALLGLGIGGALGHPLTGIAVAVSLPVVLVAALVAFRVI